MDVVIHRPRIYCLISSRVYRLRRVADQLQQPFNSILHSSVCGSSRSTQGSGLCADDHACRSGCTPCSVSSRSHCRPLRSALHDRHQTRNRSSAVESPPASRFRTRPWTPTPATYVCKFPGHWYVMKDSFTVTGITGADSMSEVVRRALAVYDLVARESATGSRILVMSADDKQQEQI